MPEKQPLLEDSGRLRRAKPAYVITVTMLAVAFWWLVGVSQTPLGQRHVPASGLHVEQQPGTSAAVPALEPAPVATPPAEDYTARLVAAMEDADKAHRQVESARATLSTAQQRWEEWLAGREARERALASAAAPPPPAEAPAEKLVINPQFAELTKNLQKLTMERDELLQRLTPEHPSVVDLNTRIAAVGQQLASVPEMITPSPSVAESPAAGSPPANRALGTVAADREALAAEAARTESELRQAWDQAQAHLDELTQAEEKASERCEFLRESAARQAVSPPAMAAARPLPPAHSPTPAAADRPSDQIPLENWHLILALGALALSELVAVKFALMLVTSERSLPLVSVGQVSALLPVPVLATFPAKDQARTAPPPPGSVTALTLWLLVCEGTMVVMAFLLAAITIRNVGFPANMLWHPIESMAQGLRDIGS